ncbi:efflux RND transporter periplasmic adaptor subunit [Rhodospirillum sp. A1_3_36]|uniref:efflux RND transporter periplasmic adaptor subunit n=1 Tax=Rhodospirillum sp. A1_3_36 TaxID=3391666 RepID=UPI0039A63030
MPDPMPAHRSPRLRSLLGLLPIVLGVAVLILAVSGRVPPARTQDATPATPARVITVPRLDVTPLITAHGPVRPDRVWQGVAEVSGRIVEVSPVLRQGVIVEKGTLLARIDAADYTLIEAQRQAQVQTLNSKRINLEASIAIEERGLTIAQAELTRKETLRARGAVSQSDVDTAARSLLSAEQTLQNLRNELNLLPAEMDQTRAQYTQAKLDVARTELVAPFDLRIASADAVEGRFAQVGQILAEGDSIAKAEVEAQVPLNRMLALNRAGGERSLSEGDGQNGMGGRLGVASQDISASRNLSAQVVLEVGETTLTWPARVERVSDTIDPTTRTLGVIVVVDEPYRRAIPGVRPPLVKNMFVTVLLGGETLPDRVVIPRHALRADGTVALVGADGTLVFQPVEVQFTQDGYAVIKEGLVGGETLVVGHLSPAIAGMEITPIDDGDTLALLTEETAAGALKSDPKTAPKTDPKTDGTLKDGDSQ